MITWAEEAYTSVITKLEEGNKMGVQINWLAVLLAGVSSMVIGFLYYMPGVLGKTWMKLGKIDQKLFEKERPQLMPLLFLAALLTAYVLAQIMYVEHSFFHNGWVASGMLASLLAWVGFSFTTLFVHNSLDQRPFNLTLISWGNRLVSLLAMGLILGWLHP